ncbi:SDR family NAD(P)-dependent oxidoreductase [Nakamurella sp. YIM 132087]|uniref:SDR family NAD(P)-dependent oxidoreductase n=1 Tax=Nakamurella alba TaxID=2665158 RepID=A0A7K1FRC7_9ACTN|nr:SDR family NAD(P)-dependent oxidoreductase [Nakamurella alba]MTD15354.1 SDR family NAD(P)-dependent oxidoreductase [Nakamurella alba]
MATAEELRSYLKRAAVDLTAARQRVAELESRLAGAPVAVTGLACRFPGGADDPAGYWDLLSRSGSGVREIPEDRFDLSAEELADRRVYARHGSFLDDVAGFDAAHFGMAPHEALRTDPQHRLLMELVWRGLEDAGLPPAEVAGSRTAVFVGFMDPVQYARVETERTGFGILADPQFGQGVSSSVVAGRIAYQFDLRGPAVTLDTACSSSLVGVHLAVQALRRGECDRAIVAGVYLILHSDPYIQGCVTRMLAPDGACKTFGADADGYVLGEGGGLVVLERLDDARSAGHRVRAVVRGSAIGQDGRSNGLTAPNRGAQVDVIRRALADAGTTADRIGYLEAHGSGTSLGDAIELGALHDVFGRRGSGPLPVGAVKTNLGHTQAAAGVAGLVKTVLTLEHGRYPANLVTGAPATAVPADGSVAPAVTGGPLDPEAWAGVSSFGWSGTNAHVVLSPGTGSGNPAAGEGDPAPAVDLLVSGSTPAAVTAQLTALADLLGSDGAPALVDVAHTLAVGRARLDHRIAVPVAAGADPVAALRSAAQRTPVRTGDPAAAHPFEAGDTTVRALPDGVDGSLVPLPPHPFHRLRFWPEREGAGTPSAGTAEGGRSAAPGNRSFRPTWRVDRTATPGEVPGPVLLVPDALGIATALAAELIALGHPVLTVTDGLTAAEAVREAVALAAGPVQLVQLSSVGAVAPGARWDPAAALPFAFDDTLAAVQALGAAGGPARLLTVTCGAQLVTGGDARAPLTAAAHGLGRSVRHEYAGMSWSGIDLDPRADVADCAAALLAELTLPPRPEVVARRAGRRHRPEWAELLEPETLPWPTDGVHLITGGTRGLGALLARRLVADGVRRIALLSRGTTDSAELVDDLTAAGATVRVLVADAADPRQLRAAVAACTAELGAPEVLVHAAGVPAGGMAQASDAVRSRAVLLPKLAPLEVVSELIDSSPALRTVVLYSSAVTAFGGLGEGDYCAANTALDAAAAAWADEARPGLRVLSVGWAPWQHDDWQQRAGGPLAEQATAYRRRFGFGAADGCDLLLQLHGTDGPVLALRQSLQEAEQSFTALLDLDALTAAARAAAAARPRFPRPDLRVAYAPPTGGPESLQSIVADVWGEFLGIDAVGIRDPFFDLGGNSLVGAAMVRELELRLDRPIPPAALYQHPTVAEFAAALGGPGGGAAEPAAALLAGSAARGARRRRARVARNEEAL